MTPTITSASLLGALLAVACASDVAQRRVPNAVVAALAAAGLAAQGAAGGLLAAVAGGLCGAGVVALFLLPWRAGWIGGGDVKLAAAAAVWLGPSRLLPFLLLTGAAGIPVALGTRVVHRLELRRLVRQVAFTEAAPALPLPRETVPYALAVAAGALAAVQGGLP